MNRELLEQRMAELPLYIYDFIDPAELEFSERIRWICENECPMYGKSWACPPGVGSVKNCEKHCRSFENCLLISTIVEVKDIADINVTLGTRKDHEKITNQVLLAEAVIIGTTPETYFNVPLGTFPNGTSGQNGN